MASTTDPELLTRINGGDVAALGRLYDRHASTLLPIALRIVRDESEAEDILHDAFVMVSERAAGYSPERGSVIAWMITMVKNLSIDRARRRDRRGAIARDVLVHEPSPAARDPERLAFEAFERDKLLRALANLPEIQRRTLEIAFFEGLSYAQIASRENLPLGTVKARAARALAGLRIELARLQVGPELLDAA